MAERNFRTKLPIRATGLTKARGESMADEDRQELIAFEAEADRQLAALPIRELPVRAFWTFYHATVFSLLHVHALENRATWVTGETLAGRIGYLLPWLRARATEPLGADAADAFEAVTTFPDAQAQIAALTLYLHFCEVMPDVHRRLIDVERTAAGAFRLTHPDAAQARAEAIDILVSELALNQNPVPENRPPHAEAFQLADTAPRWDVAVFMRLVRTMAARYGAEMIEDPLIREDAWQAIFGFDAATYREVQAALFGFADAIQQVATILAVRAGRGGQEDRAGMAEAIEWMSICWQGDVLVDTVAAIAGVDRAAVERIITTFTVDYDQPAPPWDGGEGYCPPFVRLAGARLTSPDFIKRFVHARNVLVLLERNNDPRFDNIVSGDLEPVLIAEFAQAFETIEGVRVATNYVYDLGELDMVIASADETHVIVVEAKAPLPPQGVRATARLAGRMREGLAQIARFRAQPRDQQLQQLRRATGLALDDPAIEFWLAGRACFGAREVWAADAQVRAVTLPLLRLAVAGDDQGAPTLNQLGQRISGLVEAMLADLDWRWDHSDFEMFGQKFETPQLIYDRARANVWRARAGGGPGRGAAA